MTASLNLETLISNESPRAFPGPIFNGVPSAANNDVFIAEEEGLPEASRRDMFTRGKMK